MGERNNDISQFLYDDRGGDRKERLAQANDPNRGEILPFKKDETGKNRWALPKWAMDIYNTVTLPEDTRRGYTPTGQDAAEFATNVGLGGVSSSMVAGHTADPNTLGMFLGKKAKGADTKALSHAMTLESRGAHRNEIWRQTGWFKDLDDQWKWEIPDDGLSLNTAGMEEGLKIRQETMANVGNDPTQAFVQTPPEPTFKAVQHPELFGNYPPPAPGKSIPAHGVAPIDVPYIKKSGVPGTPSYSEDSVFPYTQLALKTDDGVSSNYAGSFTGGKNQELYAQGETLDRIRWVMAHELQHAVQEREGHSSGSNLTRATNIANDFFASLPEPALKYLDSRDKITRHMKTIGDLKNRISILEDGNDLKGWTLIDNGVPEDVDLNDAITLEDLRDELNFSERVIKSEREKLPDLKKEIAPILPEVEKVRETLNRSPYDNYSRNAGEASARITQKRLDYTPEDRQMSHPLDDIDVPEEEVWTYDSVSKTLQKLRDFKEGLISKEAEAGYEEALNELIVPENEPRKYAEGGMVIDPISGNEVPPGARPEEVRDDIDIKASEGEYVIPANVVRFLGLEKIEKMVVKAQEALGALDDAGRMGGEEGEDLEELPFDIATLEGVDDPGGGPPAFAEGGLVQDQGSAGALPGVQTKQYKDANGNVIFIPWINGAPLFQPPPGYGEDAPQQVTAQAPQPMSNVSTGRGPLTDNDPSKNERTNGKSPLAGSPTEWSVDNFLDYTKQKNDIGSKAIRGMVRMMPGGALALGARDKFLDPQVSQLFDTMIETGVDPVGNQITPEQRAQLTESRNQLKKQMSDSSGLNLNPMERLTDAFQAFAKFTSPNQPQQGSSGGAPASSLSPEATRMVNAQGNNKSDNQYSGGNVSVGSDLGKQNNGPTSGSMRSGGLYKDGGLVVRPKKK